MPDRLRTATLMFALALPGLSHGQDADDLPAATGIAPAAAVGPATRRPTSLAVDPDGTAALEAYNAGRYNDAARRFLTVAQRWPREATPYLALARSRVYAGDAPGAVHAYEIYLRLSPQGGDRAKIEAELTLARSKASGQTGRPHTKTRALLQTAEVRAKSGVFYGAEGAWAAVDRALEAEYIGPELADTRDAIEAALLSSTTDAIDRWWRPAALLTDETLADLTQAWAEVARRQALNPIEEKQRAALSALAALRGKQYAEAARILAPIAPGDPGLRYAQALALLKSGREAEAESILSALVEEDPAPRLLVLLGLVRRKMGRPDGVDAIRAALLDE